MGRGKDASGQPAWKTPFWRFPLSHCPRGQSSKFWENRTQCGFLGCFGFFGIFRRLFSQQDPSELETISFTFDLIHAPFPYILLCEIKQQSQIQHT